MIKLADCVTYVDGKGHEKAALVIGTPESLTGDLNVAVKHDRFALMVFSPTGRVYHRLAVQHQDDGRFRRAPADEVAGDVAAAEAANLDSELHDL